MLGQHVYVELNLGQNEKKAGIWLEEYYICDADSNPYRMGGQRQRKNWRSGK